MKIEKRVFGLMVVLTLFVSSCAKGGESSELSLQELCAENGHHFMTMQPVMGGVPTGEPACPGCMIGANHYCDLKEYEAAVERNGP